MLSMLVVVMLSGAPKTGGVYVPENARSLVDAPFATDDELGFIHYLEFTRSEFSVHWVLETQKYAWRMNKGALEVKRPEGWETPSWEEKDGVVETSLFEDKLVFVKGSMEQRKKTARARFEREQWGRLAGRWGEGTDAITIEKNGQLVKDGKRAPAKLDVCAPDCAEVPAICITREGTLWLEQGDALIEMPDERALCAGNHTGTPTQGTERKRATAAPKAATATLVQVRAALEARRRNIAECWLEARPAETKLTVQLARSGLIERVQVANGTESIAYCITGVLARLAFAPQSESRPFEIDLSLDAQ
jgi:hypothetical protein